MQDVGESGIIDWIIWVDWWIWRGEWRDGGNRCSSLVSFFFLFLFSLVLLLFLLLG